MVPFAREGAEDLAGQLCEHFNAEKTVSAEVLRIPFSCQSLEELAEQIFLHATLQLPNVDRVIALGFPAYLMAHPVKILWLIQRCRQVDELRDDVGPNLAAGSLKGRVLEMIHGVEAKAFSQSRRIFVDSKVSQERIKRFTGFDADVLIPPRNNPALWPVTIERLLS